MYTGTGRDNFTSGVRNGVDIYKLQFVGSHTTDLYARITFAFVYQQVHIWNI